MIEFIVNPAAKSGRGIRIWNRIKRQISADMEYAVYFTEADKNAGDVIREIVADKKAHTIFFLGGDGTANEVINGVANYDNLTLGVIPCGSGNDFVRSLGLKGGPVKIAKHLLHSSNRRRIAIGNVTFGGQDGMTRRFIVSTGIGCDADICTQGLDGWKKKMLNALRIGNLVYTLIALKHIFAYKPARGYVEVDGERTELDTIYFSSIHNCAYEGGGFCFCPDTNCEDDSLDVCIVAGKNVPEVLPGLILSIFGKHKNCKSVTMKQGRIIELGLERVSQCHTDGEAFGKSESIIARISDSVAFVV